MSCIGTRASGGTPVLTPRFVPLNLAKSVPPVCYALALLMNVTGLEVPPLVGSLIGALARANMPLVLLLLGIFMDSGISREELGQLGRAVALRYVAGLATGGLLFFLLPYDAEYRRIMLVALLLPEGAPEALQRLSETHTAVSKKNIQEVFHDALYYRDEVRSGFLHGAISLRERASLPVVSDDGLPAAGPLRGVAVETCS